jgi:chlorite dismutase
VAAPDPLGPSVGWNVVHLFLRASPDAEAGPALEAIDAARKDQHQVITASIVGHKADLCVLGLGPDLHLLRRLQTSLRRASFDTVDSYVSMTEVSEYASGVPEEMKQARLYPTLPPEGMPAFCFYPMSKRRAPGAGPDNWFSLPYDERLRLMVGHGAVGREFRGRVLQLVTGSTGVDDFEWGVTLFGVRPDDLKDCVYRMRFDEGSARFAEFGPFYTGIVGEADDVLAEVGVA